MIVNKNPGLDPYVLAAIRRRGFSSVRTVNTSLGFRRSVRTVDALMTFDQQTVDSAGAFLVGELERLDQKLHLPLISVTWGRDINTREDVSMGDEDSSFTNSTFATTQGIAGSNKSWASKDGTAVAGLSLDIGKTIAQLPIWAQELSWTLPELASAQKVGRPVDQQKYAAMLEKYQMDVDEEVYIGDSVLGMNGMLNHASMINTGNALNGSWATASPAQILADINSLLTNVWQTSSLAFPPSKLLVDSTSMSILVSTLISTAGNISVMKFVMDNNIALSAGIKLDIQSTKWLTGTGQTIGNVAGRGPTATNAMFAYTNDQDRIRIPIVPLQRTPLEFRGIRQLTTYFGRLGGVELVYPSTVGRRSGL